MINGQCLPPRSPGGEKYEVDRNLNRDGVSCYCEVSPDENCIQTLLSLAELLHYCLSLVLCSIGGFHARKESFTGRPYESKD